MSKKDSTDLFAPYGEETSSTHGGTRRWSQQDEDRILEAVQLAEEMGIPLSSVYSKLADDLDRTEKAIEVRTSILKRRLRDEEGESNTDDDEDDGRESVLSRLKTLVRERDYYKARYEASEDKIKDYDRIARELRQIRRILGE